MTKIYHPNVDKETGAICQDIYRKDWGPLQTLLSTLETIRTMMLTPQLDTPIEAEIAREYSENPAGFKASVTAWVEKYARK